MSSALPADRPTATHQGATRSSSGTFPVSKGYRLKQMLYNPDSHPTFPNSGSRTHDSDTNEYGLVASTDGPDAIIAPLPFGDAPIFADTADLGTVAFHQFWGCLLTPENIAAQIHTDTIRYHAWVAAKKVIERNRPFTSGKGGKGPLRYIDDAGCEGALLDATMDHFLVEVGLALLDLCPGPVVVFVDPRLHNNVEAMVDRAQSLIALFDGANVRRWRVVVTLPATEEGIRAAAIVTHKYSIQTNLSLVSCLPHASACLEAGARVITISLRGVLEWYEKQQKLVPRVTTDHPGIEAVQMCVSYILRHKLNTILMAADIRSWLELKQLSGIGAAALTQQQLDQIPMRTLATWFPRTDDTSRSTQQVREAPYPTRYLDAKKGFFLSLLPAECRSLVSAVLYVRLGEMSTWMEQITAILREEVRYRIELMSMDLRGLYQHRRKDRNHGSGEGQRPPMRRLRSSSSLASVRDGDQGKQEGYSSSPAGNTTAPMIEGVDYF